MKLTSLTGKLIAVDMYSCNDAVLHKPADLQAAVEKGCRDFALQPMQVMQYDEAEQIEYMLFAACRLGHVTLHVYPDIGFVAADIFSCCEGANPAGMAKYLRSCLDADKSKITLLDRGDFGSESDMKPSRRSKIKFIRRTENIGGKLKKIMLKPRSM